MALKIGEDQQVQMPMKTVASLISICVIGAWFAFSVIERLNVLETKSQLVEKDLESANNWAVYSSHAGFSDVQDYLLLNTTAAVADNGASIWGAAFPTSSVLGFTTGQINNANKDTLLKYIQHIRVLKLRINNEILYKTKFSDVFNLGNDDDADQDIVSVLSNVDSAIKKKTDVINQLNILEKSLIDHYNYHKKLLDK
mgnify:CR=1 FL=1